MDLQEENMENSPGVRVANNVSQGECQGASRDGSQDGSQGGSVPPSAAASIQDPNDNGMPPVGVWTASGIWVALGVFGVTSFIFRLAYASEMVIDQTLIFCGLFVWLGYQLMTGSRRARGWSIGLSIIVMIAIPINLTLFFVSDLAVDFAWYDYGYWGGVTLLIACTAAYLFSALKTPAARNWFGVYQGGVDHGGVNQVVDSMARAQLAKKMIWGLLPVLLVMSALVELNQFWIHKSVKDPFQVDAQFALVDEQTGTAANKILAINIPSRWTQPKGYGVKVVERSVTANGLLTRLRGRSSKPIRLKLSAEGFEPKVIEIAGNTEGIHTIQLQRAKSFNAQDHLFTPLNEETKITMK